MKVPIDIIVRIGLDVVLFAAIIANFITLRRVIRAGRVAQQAADELTAFNRDKFPRMIEALEAMACTTCPMCAIAAGKATGDLGGDPMVAEEEVAGEHVVHTHKGARKTAACLAAVARQHARDLFAEAQGEKAGKISIIQVKGERDGRD
jgi:hypothetical protein